MFPCETTNTRSPRAMARACIGQRLGRGQRRRVEIGIGVSMAQVAWIVQCQRCRPVAVAATHVMKLIFAVRGVEQIPERAARMHCESEKQAPAGSTSTWPGTTRCQVEANQHQTLKADPPESRKVKAIQVHHLVPSHHKVMDKLFLRVRRCVDLGQGAQLGA